MVRVHFELGVEGPPVPSGFTGWLSAATVSLAPATGRGEGELALHHGFDALLGAGRGRFGRDAAPWP